MTEFSALATSRHMEYQVEKRRLPFDLRLLLYDAVLMLRAESFGYPEIITRIENQYHVTLAKSTISGWVSGANRPQNAGHFFIPTPTPELAYVIGVKTGDASLNVKVESSQCRIRLQAVDREFVQAFNLAVAKTLGCPAHRLWKGTTAREIHVEFGSYLLHSFLSKPWVGLKKFIEHDEFCAAAFLRGFFDSEGCISPSGEITASNSDVELLNYVRDLLESFFGILTTGPRICTRRGSLMVKGGKSFRRRVDCYYIYVRKQSQEGFHVHVGFTIERKRRRLLDALGIE